MEPLFELSRGNGKRVATAGREVNKYLSVVLQRRRGMEKKAKICKLQENNQPWRRLKQHIIVRIVEVSIRNGMGNVRIVESGIRWWRKS